MILPYKITHLLNFLNSFPKLDRIYRKREKETWIQQRQQYSQDIQHPIYNNLPQINLPKQVFKKKQRFMKFRLNSWCIEALGIY